MAEMRSTFNDKMVPTSALNFIAQFANKSMNLKLRYKVALNILMLYTDLQLPPPASNKEFLHKVKVSMCFTVSQLAGCTLLVGSRLAD